MSQRQLRLRHCHRSVEPSTVKPVCVAGRGILQYGLCTRQQLDKIMQHCVIGKAPLTCGLRSSNSCRRKNVSSHSLLLCHLSLKLSTDVPFGSSNRSNNSTVSKTRHNLEANCPINRVVVHGIGKDTVEGWIDLSKLVSGSSGIKTAYEDLAYNIGESPWSLFQLE